MLGWKKQKRADSGLKCNTILLRLWLLHEDLMRGFESWAFSGTMTQAMHGEGDVLIGNVLEAHFFG